MARIAKIEAQAQECERPGSERASTLMKHTVTKSNRRFCTPCTKKFTNRPEFKGVKQIVLPFRVAQEVAEHFGVQIAYDKVEPELSDPSAVSDEKALGLR
ncbi:unnamed protein product [Peronospora destructor]|uniref:Uncharacterized protein n=1 Tax=Peronospora destructor TaxID=86335 RepID=A0AAV0VC95_9STRA|nr:unnamed protein product [Peronospora destructor]